MSREGREGSEGYEGTLLMKKTNYSDEEAVGKLILDAAFKVHTALGPGLLESVYEAALAKELERRDLSVERQKPVPVYYEDALLEVGFRVDLLVESKVLVELKSVENITPMFKKITTNYVRLLGLKLGFLINFSEAHLKDGITRVVNGLEGKLLFQWQKQMINVDLKTPSLTSRPSRDTLPRNLT
jgi:GxxExxY protein